MILENNLKNKVFSGIFWKFGERILAQLVSFVVSIVLARLLLPEQYGIIAMITVFITIANVFVTSGFSTSLIQKKDADETDFSTIFWCSLLVACIIYFLLFISAGWIADFYSHPLLKPVLRVFSLKIIISSYNSIQHAYVSRHMIFKRFFFSTLFGTLLSGVVGIIMAMQGFGVWALVAQYLINSVVDSIVLTITISWRPKLLFSYNSAKKLMGYGWKILAADFMGTFFDQLRSFVIGKWYMPADLAYYNKGKQIPDLLSNNISATIITVLFPAIANQNNDLLRVKKMTQKSIRTASYIMSPLIVGTCVVSKTLVIVLLTEKWLPCTIFMQLMCMNALVGIIGNTSLQTVKAMGRSDILLKLEFYKKPVYLLLLIIGAHFSVLGIAITQVIYAVYGTIINGGVLKKIIHYTYWEQVKDLLESMGLALLMGAGVYILSFVRLSNFFLLIIQLICGAIIYIIGSNILRIKEFVYLKEILLQKIKKEK